MADKKKQCFVVSPIGKPGSDNRIHADWLLEGIIKPVFAEHYPDFEIVRADTISAPGLIDTQIIEPLLDADLVIADITTLNPNVFYEIGIRHVVQKPIVHMHLEGESIPFDISIFRSIPFSRTAFHDVERAKNDLKKALSAVFIEDYRVDNPVTRTRARFEFEKSASPKEQVLIAEIEALNQRLANLERVPVVTYAHNNDRTEFDVTISAVSSWGKENLTNIFGNELSKVAPDTNRYGGDEDTITFKVYGQKQLKNVQEIVRKSYPADLRILVKS